MENSATAYIPIYKIDSSTSKIYDKARQLCEAGKGQKEIADALNLPVHTVISLASGRWRGHIKTVGTFTPPEDAPPVVKKMYQDAKALSDEGKTLRQISARLGISSGFVRDLAHGKYFPKKLATEETASPEKLNIEALTKGVLGPCLQRRPPHYRSCVIFSHA